MLDAILPRLEEIKKSTDYILNHKDTVDDKDIENHLRTLEKARYEIFDNIDLKNKKKKDKEKIDYINNHYEACMHQGVLKIYIPEVLPKYKNISNFAYKNILISTSKAVRKYSRNFWK